MSNVRQSTPGLEVQDLCNFTVIQLWICYDIIEIFKVLPYPVGELIDVLLKIIQISEGNALPFT